MQIAEFPAEGIHPLTFFIILCGQQQNISPKKIDSIYFFDKKGVLCYILSGEEVKRRNSRGMTLLELLVGVSIILILISGAGLQLRGLIQKAKVIAAKATINGFALCLSMIKADTSLYPEQLAEVQGAGPPEAHGEAQFSAMDWNGPFGLTLSLKDPWGTDYFYWLTETAVFGPVTIERTTGEPYVEVFNFTATAGYATLIVENPGVSSGSITLKADDLEEVEIVSQEEFQKITPLIIKDDVWLGENNTVTVRLTSTPGLTIDLKITASVTSPDATFILGSKGKDRVFGGTEFNAEIVYGYFR